MTIDEIKELLDLFNESGVGELEIEREGERIRIRKAGHGGGIPGFARFGRSRRSRPETSCPLNRRQPPREQPRMPGQILVKSPIVGTYYDAAVAGRRRPSSTWAMRSSPARCSASSSP